MGFLSADDAIVIMDVCPECMGADCRHISFDDLRRLRDCGVRTVLEYVAWNRIEQVMGKRDWSHLDSYVDRARRAGMKVILSTPHSVPGCFPAEWYPWDRAGRPMKGNSTIGDLCVLSIFNDEALDYEVGFIGEVRGRYEDEDVFLFCAQQVEGETVYQNNWAYGEPSAQAAWKLSTDSGNGFSGLDFPRIDGWLFRRYREVLVELQEAFLRGSRHGEIWSALHPLLSEEMRPECRGNGCRWIERYFEAYREAWPGVEMTWLQYTFWPHADGYRRKVQEVRGRFGMGLVVGAEWVTGLRENTGKAIEHGVSALLLGIQHPFSGVREIEEWMFEAVEKSCRELIAAKGEWK